MKNVPVHLLNSAYIFSKSQSLKEAAQRLGISQPGLSKQLKLLQTLLPQPCFATEGKNKVFTRFGLAIVQEYEERFQGFQEKLTQISGEHSTAELATIRVAGRREILDRFSDQMTFPGRIIFSILSNAETAVALIKGKIDFGVTWLLPDSTEIIAKHLFTERYQIVIPKSLLGSPLDKSMAENLKALAKIPCVTYKENDEVFRKLFEHYQINKNDLVIKRTTANYQNLVRMLKFKVGWSIVPIHYHVSKTNNLILPITEGANLSRPFYLVYRKQVAKLEWAKSAIHEIQICFKK